jgi:hypothetical protein
MPIKDPTPEKAKLLVAGPLGEALTHAAMLYSAPVYWSDRSSVNGMEDIRNGTTFFLDCGAGLFGVTAAHVFNEFAEVAAIGIRCQIGSSPQLFDLRERLIARGKMVDIATYRISAVELASVQKEALTGWQSVWPPKPPELDRGVVFSGYPGADRRIVRPRHIEWGIYSGLGVADSVSDRDVSCVINHQYMVPSYWATLLPVGHDLGGMSGAPMLAVVQSEVVGWRLAGVIYECGRNLLEVVKAARADFIRTDGTLNE